MADAPPLLAVLRGALAVQLPEELRGPLVFDLEERQTLSDLKEMVLDRLGSDVHRMGLPRQPGGVYLSEVWCPETPCCGT